MSIGRARDRSRGRGGAVVVAAAAFTPASLSPFAWHRLDLGVTLNGGNVASLADQSGNGKTLAEATAGNQPLYTASSAAFGSKPILGPTASTTKGLQAAAAADWSFLHNGTGMTVMLVGRSRGAAGSHLWGTHSSAGVTPVGFSLLVWTGANLRAVVGNGAAGIVDCVTSANSFATTAGHVVIVTYRTGVDPDLVVRIDRAQVGTASETGVPSVANPVGPLSIGYATDKSAGGDCDVAESVVWNRVLSAGEITQLEAYSLTQFGV